MLKTIKEIFRDFSDDILKKIFRTAIEKFTKRTLAISFCTGFLFSLAFYETVFVFVFVFIVWLYLLYSTWQKTKEAILKQDKEQ